MNYTTNHSKTGKPRSRFLRKASMAAVFLCCLNVFVSEVSGICHAAETRVQAGDDRTVTGIITDQQGEPIIGASVMLEGTGTGTISDIDGAFTLNAPESGRLIISYLGFQDLYVNLTSKSDYRLVMQWS